MKKMKLTPSILIVFVLVLAMLVGNAYAKYVTQKEVQGNINITARLGNIALCEHKVTWNNQAYVMDNNELVSYNDYALIPGMTIPKDTYVKITEKTPISVYVYLEVVGGSAVSYAIDDTNWKTLDGVIGMNGGTVYVYKDIVTGQTDAIEKINIFQNQQICVNSDATADNTQLVIYATMYQTAAGNDAAAVYNVYKP